MQTKAKNISPLEKSRTGTRNSQPGLARSDQTHTDVSTAPGNWDSMRSRRMLQRDIKKVNKPDVEPTEAVVSRKSTKREVQGKVITPN